MVDTNDDVKVAGRCDACTWDNGKVEGGVSWVSL